MANDNYEADNFQTEVNRLGLLAVASKDTEDFQEALDNLINYFKANYIFYLVQEYEKKTCPGIYATYFNQNFGNDRDEMLKKHRQALENINIKYLAVIKSLPATLKNKVSNYDPDKISNEKNPFFGYISFDIFKKGKDAVNENSRGEWGLKREDRLLLEKILDVFDALELPYSSIVGKEEAIKELGISEKLFDQLMTISQKSIDFEDVNNKVFDSYINPLEDGEELMIRILLKMNDVYRIHFVDKHKIVFPKEFTNKLINNSVDLVRGKKNKSFEQTVADNWDELDIEYMHKTYANGDYLCVDSLIFIWFEEVKRQIFSKEIAEKIGVSPSYYTKIYLEAKALVKEIIPELNFI